MDRYTKGFVLASITYLLAGALLGIWMGAEETPEWSRFAHVHFNLLGFMAMMVYGVGYFILPRFNARELKWPQLLPVHFYLANVGLVGLVMTASERPGASFTVFALLNVISVVMFSLNICATILMPANDKETTPEPEPVEPQIEIGPDTRMGDIISNWPELTDILVNNGFTPLADQAHREKVKQMPITLGMACERHGIDVDMISSLLTQGANSIARKKQSVQQPLQSLSSIKGTISKGNRITHQHVIGDILKAYPETESVFRKYYGAACFSCPGQATESIRQSAMMHNVDESKILTELNDTAGLGN